MAANESWPRLRGITYSDRASFFSIHDFKAYYNYGWPAPEKLEDLVHDRAFQVQGSIPDAAVSSLSDDDENDLDETVHANVARAGVEGDAPRVCGANKPTEPARSRRPPKRRCPSDDDDDYQPGASDDDEYQPGASEDDDYQPGASDDDDYQPGGSKKRKVGTRRGRRTKATSGTSQDDGKTKISNTYRCDDCPDKTFTRLIDLERHLKTSDAHTGGSKLRCPRCNTKISRQDAMKRHMLKKGCR